MLYLFRLSNNPISYKIPYKMFTRSQAKFQREQFQREQQQDEKDHQEKKQLHSSIDRIKEYLNDIDNSRWDHTNYSYREHIQNKIGKISEMYAYMLSDETKESLFTHEFARCSSTFIPSLMERTQYLKRELKSLINSEGYLEKQNELLIKLNEMIRYLKDNAVVIIKKPTQPKQPKQPKQPTQQPIRMSSRLLAKRNQ